MKKIKRIFLEHLHRGESFGNESFGNGSRGAQTRLSTGVYAIDLALDDCDWVNTDQVKLSYSQDEMGIKTTETLIFKIRDSSKPSLDSSTDKSLVCKKSKNQKSKYQKSKNASKTSNGKFPRNHLESIHGPLQPLVHEGDVLLYEDMSLFLYEQSIEELVGSIDKQSGNNDMEIKLCSKQLLSTYRALENVKQEDCLGMNLGASLSDVDVFGQNKSTLHKTSFLTVSEAPQRSEQDLLKEKLSAQTERILELLLFSL